MQAKLDLWGRQAVQENHADGQERAQDQSLTDGPPLPDWLSNHHSCLDGPWKKTLKQRERRFNNDLVLLRATSLYLLKPFHVNTVKCAALCVVLTYAESSSADSI